MRNLKVGQVITLGWNSAKTLGDEFASNEVMRVEAAGQDWVVLRRSNGKALSGTFDSLSEIERFFSELTVLYGS